MPVYGSIFAVLSIASFVGAARGGVWLALTWPGVAFAVVVYAYLTRQPRVLGKRADGSFAWWRRLFFLPFIVFSEGAWHLFAAVTREDAYNAVAPGVWVGRWPEGGHLPEGVDVVVDVTAELPAHRRVIREKRYVCLPAMDATVPEESAFRALVAELADARGGIFVHCAFGHGRSAMLAGALLVARGLAPDAAAAEGAMRRARPGISLSGLQRAYVERFAAARGSTRPEVKSPPLA